MDLLKPLVRYITHPYFLRRDGYEVAPVLQELNESQFFPLNKLLEIRIERLRDLLLYCEKNNRFYKERFKRCQFDPNDIKSLDDLSLLPLLTKDDIRKAGNQLFSDSYSVENTVHKRTGGSTGVPLHVYMDYSATSQKKAATLRHNSWANLIPGARLAAVWGDTTKKLPWKTRLRNTLTERAIYLDTLRFDTASLEQFVAKLQRYHPPVILGHAHSIFRFAEFVRDKEYKNISFEGIITTAMVLSPSERETIEAVFDSPVFNRYGCEELSIIASECDAHNGMHIFAEGLIVESISENASMPGKLVITDLFNRAMPLIRYEIGDYGIVEESVCSCGRTLPRLMEVSGRTADFLYRPDGTPVFGISILDTFVIHIAGLKQVQIIQDSYDHLDFLVVRDNSFSDESLSQLQKNVVDIFGTAMTYDIQYVESIPQTRAGKYRFSICNIDKEKKP